MSTVCDTFQSVKLDSPEGKRFLRRIAKSDQPWKEEWSATAGPSTDWRLVFRRTVSGKLGEPDTTIEVMTDCEVRRSGKQGNYRAFSDAKEVYLRTINRIIVTGSECRAMATMLAQGATLTAHASAGSTSSSELGLSFYPLEANIGPYCSVTIGETLACNDRVLVSGPCDVR